MDDNMKAISAKDPLSQWFWLTTDKVLDILRNYESYNFHLTENPPHKPESGSLYLFDRSKVRNYRADSHDWNIIKGSTVLKENGEEVIRCTYSTTKHGGLRRRCYWLLKDPKKDIVFVHYLRELDNSPDITNQEQIMSNFKVTSELLESQGMTFLQLASAEGCHWALPYLTGLVDINEADLNGCTPLHWAAGNGRLEMVHALIQEGADPEPIAHLQLQDGITEDYTPAQQAQRRGHGKVFIFLFTHICEKIWMQGSPK